MSLLSSVWLPGQTPSKRGHRDAGCVCHQLGLKATARSLGPWLERTEFHCWDTEHIVSVIRVRDSEWTIEYLKTFSNFTWIWLKIFCDFWKNFCNSFIGDIYFLKQTNKKKKTTHEILVNDKRWIRRKTKLRITGDPSSAPPGRPGHRMRDKESACFLWMHACHGPVLNAFICINFLPNSHNLHVRQVGHISSLCCSQKRWHSLLKFTRLVLGQNQNRSSLLCSCWATG